MNMKKHSRSSVLKHVQGASRRAVLLILKFNIDVFFSSICYKVEYTDSALTRCETEVQVTLAKGRLIFASFLRELY